MKRLFMCLVCMSLLFFACNDDESEEPQLFRVTINDALNGSAAAEPATCEAGKTVMVTATPDEGYCFVEWKVVSGGVTLTDAAVNPLTLTMPEGDVVLEVVFTEEIIPYGIEIGAAENGSVKAATVKEEEETEVTEAPEGTAITLTATPDAGYEFVGWTVEGLELAEGEVEQNPLTVTMPKGKISVTATFKEMLNVLDEIEDPTFKKYVEYCMRNATKATIGGETVEQAMWDRNLDDILSEKEAAAVQFIDLHHFFYDADEEGEDYDPIESLKGLEYFTGLRRLDIYDEDEKGFLDVYELELDLSGCKELEELDATNIYGLSKVILGEKPQLKYLNLDLCWDLEGIDLDGCPNLEELLLASDYITELDLSKCTQLKKLTLQLYMESLDLSANKELTYLYLFGCSELTSLDISNQTKLAFLNCAKCSLESVDITKMASGTYTAIVGSQESGELKLTMRADQEEHWENELSDNYRNDDVTVIVKD